MFKTQDLLRNIQNSKNITLILRSFFTKHEASSGFWTQLS